MHIQRVGLNISKNDNIYAGYESTLHEGAGRSRLDTGREDAQDGRCRGPDAHCHARSRRTDDLWGRRPRHLERAGRDLRGPRCGLVEA